MYAKYISLHELDHNKLCEETKRAVEQGRPILSSAPNKRSHVRERRSHDYNTQPLASQKGTLELFLSWLWDLVCNTLKSLPSQEEIDTPKEHSWIQGSFKMFNYCPK